MPNKVRFEKKHEDFMKEFSKFWDESRFPLMNPKIRAEYRKAVDARNAQIKEPHCKICGEIEDDDKWYTSLEDCINGGNLVLATTEDGDSDLFCRECFDIQTNM